jgi:hypothetical protein
MPDMDAYELIRKFRRDDPTVKVITIGGGLPRTPGAPYLELAGQMSARWVLRKLFRSGQFIGITGEATAKADPQNGPRHLRLCRP